jgi:signal transduction histidine kinase
VCHKRDLSPTEKRVAEYTLRAFLNPIDQLGLEGYLRSSVEDVACYYPEYKIDCAHCQNWRNENFFASLAKEYLGSDVDDHEIRRVLSQVKQLHRANSLLSWSFILQAINLNRPIDDLLLAGYFFLKGLVPSSVAAMFDLSQLEASQLVLKKTETWSLHNLQIVENSKLEIQEERDALEVCLTLSIDEIRKHLVRVPVRLYKVITEKVIQSEDQAEILKWFSYLDSVEKLRPQEYSQLLDAFAESQTSLSSELRKNVLTFFAERPRREFFIKVLLNYCARLRDEVLSEECLRILANDSARATSAEVHHALEHSLKVNWYKSLNLLLRSPNLLAKVDFQTLDWLYEKKILGASYNKIIIKTAEALRNNWAEADYFALLKSYQPLKGRISPVGMRNISDATQNQMLKIGRSARGKNLEGLSLLALSTFIEHPEIHEISREVFKTVLSAATLKGVELVGQYLVSDSYDHRALKNLLVRTQDERIRLDLLPIRYFNQSPENFNLRNYLPKYFLDLIEEEIHVPSLIFETFLFAIFQIYSVKEGALFIEELIHLPGGLRIRELNSVANLLLKFDGKQEHGLAFIEQLEHNQIPVTEFVKYHVLKYRSESGELFTRGIVEGPQDQYWSQLAIIFDDVVHEINQPLLSLGLNIEILKRTVGAAGEGVKEVLKSLSEAQKELATRMVHYQALTSEGTNSSWIDVTETIQKVIDDLAPQAVNAKVEIFLDATRIRQSAYVFGPPFQFRIALRNLIRNAITAFDERSKLREIKVSVFRLKGFLDQVMISISDTGPGIPESEQTKIFQRGFTTKLGRGLGLGLSLSASVIKNMGGTLKLDKTSSAGSTFLMVLPVETEIPIDIPGLSRKNEYTYRVEDGISLEHENGEDF